MTTKLLQYAYFPWSPVDHIVKDAAFGGAITLWCGEDYMKESRNAKFAYEPRSKGKVCVNCQDKRAEQRNKIVHEFGAQGCYIDGRHTLAEHRTPQEAPY